MAASYGQRLSNDKQGVREDTFSATLYNAGALNGSFEGIVGLPYSGADGQTSGNGWELRAVILGAGTNTTHDTTDSITATVEKNSDGGTNALATNPVLDSDAGTGAKNTASSGDGVTQAVVHGTEANRQFSDGDMAFVTVTEAGSGGTDPSDVFVTLTFARIQDYDPAA